VSDDRRTDHWRRVRQGLAEAVRGWLYDPNVRFVDYGFREKDGELRMGEEPRIRVHVVKKIPAGPALEAATATGVTSGEIPPQIAGIPVDCPQGAYRLHQSPYGGRAFRGAFVARGKADVRTSRIQPLRGGISISDARRPIAGTLGGPVFDRSTGQTMILSNWHVLSGVFGRPGGAIFQPGRLDGGTLTDRVATLDRDAMASNLDAAVARLGDERPVVNGQWGLHPVRGSTVAQLGMLVGKSGRTSGVTRGMVTGVEGTQRAYYAAAGYRVIRHVISITPGDAELSLPGDSGAFWVDEATNKVVALHFAGNQPGETEEALAIDIGPILDALGVDLYV
jgi:endonuclease G